MLRRASAQTREHSAAHPAQALT